MPKTHLTATSKLIVSQREADQWNTMHAVGTAVTYNEVMNDARDFHTTTRSDAFVPKGTNYPVVFLTNKAGWVLLSHVRKRFVDEEAECLTQFAV